VRARARPGASRLGRRARRARRGHHPGGPVMTTLDERATTWLTVCRLDELARERGAAALVTDEVDGAPLLTQVALFRLLDDTVLAVQQHDPFSDAHVLSRGIVGT